MNFQDETVVTARNTNSKTQVKPNQSQHKKYTKIYINKCHIYIFKGI